MTDSVRHQGIDIARGMAALLIMTGHALAFRQQTGWLADSSHIGSPLFFFLSGVFLSLPQSWPIWSMQKADALLKPYLLVLAAMGVAYAILGRMDWLNYVSGVLFANGSSIVLLPLWFLPHLFLSLCCAALLLWVGCSSTVWWIFVLAVLACVPSILAMLPALPLSADLLPVSIPLVIAGYLLSRRVKGFTANLPLFCVASAIFFGLLLYRGAAIDMNLRIYRDHFYTPVFIASGIFVLLCVAAWLQTVRWLGEGLAFLGRYSLLVLLFHFLWLRRIFHYLKESPVDSVNMQVMIAVVLCVLLCVGTIKLVCASRWLSLLLLPAISNRRRQST